MQDATPLANNANALVQHGVPDSGFRIYSLRAAFAMTQQRGEVMVIPVRNPTAQPKRRFDL